MKLRPCIDIHGGRVKQIVGGSIGADRGVEENFVSGHDAAWYASLYRSKGLDGGHIILLDSRQADPDAYEADRKQALGALAAFPGGMQIGGGITPENAAEYLDAGASHVIVTSYVFRDGMLDGERLRRMQKAVGRDRLVLDLSCRRIPDCPQEKYAVVTDRWQRFTQWAITHEKLCSLCSECQEFLVHAADVEGKRGGIQQGLVRILGGFAAESGFPVTYAGGVHDLDDLDRIAGLSGGSLDVTVGSALSVFGGSLDLDVLASRCSVLSD